MDQTLLPFEYLSGRTYALKGDKTVWAKSIKSGWNKQQVTPTFTVFADGVTQVKPIMIFKGTENKERQQFYYGEEPTLYDDRVVVWFNKKGYANTEVLLQ